MLSLVMMKKDKTKGTLEIIAALIVLFSSMLNPILSLTLAVIALIAFAIWEFIGK